MMRFCIKFPVLLVALLLYCGAEPVHAADLISAVAANDVEQVREILKGKPDLEARDSFGGVALHGAMFGKDIEIVKLLIDNGCDINVQGTSNGYTPLHDAVWANNVEAAKLLIEKGAKLDIEAKHGLTPLAKAEKEGKEEIAALLKKAISGTLDDK